MIAIRQNDGLVMVLSTFQFHITIFIIMYVYMVCFHKHKPFHWLMGLNLDGILSRHLNLSIIKEYALPWCWYDVKNMFNLLFLIVSLFRVLLYKDGRIISLTFMKIEYALTWCWYDVKNVFHLLFLIVFLFCVLFYKDRKITSLTFEPVAHILN